MLGAKVLLVLAVAGCRGGFDRLTDGMGDDDGADEPITVTVMSDEGFGTPAAPVRRATVLIERDGVIDQLVTDDAGLARFPSDDVTAFHIVYQNNTDWRIYTIAVPELHAVELGGRSMFVVDRSMTVVVPQGPRGTIDLFAATVPERCGGSTGTQSTSTLRLNFRSRCDGMPTRMLVFGFVDGRSTAYIDAGNVTLVDDTTYEVAGTYAAMQSRTIEISNLPPGTTAVSAGIAARDAVELTWQNYDRPSSPVVDRSATASIMAVPGGDTLVVWAVGQVSQYASQSIRTAPASLDAATRVDAAEMVPLFTSFIVDRPPELSWTGGGRGGTLIAVETSTPNVKWTAYLEPSATSVTFPPALADLGVPVPPLFDDSSVTKFDVPGATAADLVRTLDRTWPYRPSQPDLATPEGGSLSSISYSSSYGSRTH
jgi:hypothetical protein